MDHTDGTYSPLRVTKSARLHVQREDGSLKAVKLADADAGMAEILWPFGQITSCVNNVLLRVRTHSVTNGNARAPNYPRNSRSSLL